MVRQLFLDQPEIFLYVRNVVKRLSSPKFPTEYPNVLTICNSSPVPAAILELRSGRTHRRLSQ